VSQEKKLDAEELRGLGLPGALVQEFLEVDALQLAAPAPPEELVQKTLEACEEALRSFEARPEKKAAALVPAVSTDQAGGFAEFVGALSTCVAADGFPYAQAHPQEPAVVLVDNHEVIEPQRWQQDPSLLMLGQLYRGVDRALAASAGAPLQRFIILKADPGAYAEGDLQVIRRAIEEPTTQETYLVAAKDAGPFRERGLAIVARSVMFEIEKGAQPDSVQVKEPAGVRDPDRAQREWRAACNLSANAFRVYEGGRLHPRLEAACRSRSTQPLLNVLQSIGNGYHG
jgi:hypothetical protein